MPARFAHSMPFGAEIRQDGTTRFRLWAPSHPEIGLVLDGRTDAPLPMTAAADGWFELTTDRAPAGTKYQYRLPDGLCVPDPASRFQPEDVNGPSLVVDPTAYEWRNTEWRGRPWEETILYELHVGCFTDDGTYDGVRRKLDHLAKLGVTAIEFLPLADFAGRRGWGYDGVLPYAPDDAYGSPDALKRVIDEAHGRGLMVFLDVVYNHFGPEGNYLSAYAKSFFTERHHTPWGAAINFDGKDARPVRDYFINNALYWLDEYRFDGLRFDAVHAIIDDSEPHILTELAETVRARVEAGTPGRHIHLVLENEANQANRLERDVTDLPPRFTAQWNDDFHNTAHALVTGEWAGYYEDFADESHAKLARSLADGFVYQGEPSPHQKGKVRGEASDHLPPQAFVSFLQNHDQVGNRAMGERLSALIPPERLRAITAVFLLTPQIPMLFMGEEWASARPFNFFTDFHGELADAVREGRRKEFAGFAEFSDPEARKRIPDPNDEKTFIGSRLDWDAVEKPGHAEWLEWYRMLIDIRTRHLVPRLAGMGVKSVAKVQGGTALVAYWPLRDGGRLTLVANLGDAAVDGVESPTGDLLFETDGSVGADLQAGRLGPWAVACHITEPSGTV
jgi:malto-oligosyltrehalose trehalohydrolase